ncbi:autotransporter assembly complex protein TamA [Ignatzschineria sp. LJL83]
MKKIKLPYLILLMLLFLLSPSFAERTMEIKIEGISDKKALENAQNAAEIYSLQGKTAPTDLRIQWLYEEGTKQIAAALQPYGYYRATIKGDLIYQKDTIVATYHVNPGAQIPIKTLELGVTDLEKLKEKDTETSLTEYQDFSKILSSSKLKVGAPLNHPDYESTKDQLSQQASTLGYFDAYYPYHEIIVNLDSYTSDINLQMTLGDRYLFGSTTFHQKYFADEFLDRFLHNMRESSEYSDQKLVALQSTFNEANYFEDVVIVPKTNAETKEVPLDIYLRPRKQRTLSLGAGYSSDIGPKIMGGVTWHYLNPYGHKLQTNLLYGQKKRDGLINYQIPGTDPTQDMYNIFVKYEYENTSTKDYTTYLAGISKDREREQYKYGYSLHYQYDKFRDINGSKQHSKLLIPTFYGEWKTAPVIPFDQFGVKITGKVRGAVDKVASDLSFLQASIGIHAYIPLGVDNRFIVRGSIGNTSIQDKDLNKLPPSLRFYTGGDNTVRGYKYDGIGEKGYNGEIYGGKKLVVASVEYEHKIAPSFAIAGFVDAGDAYNHKANLKYGAGAGIRWYSPIGSVRLDLAHGFDKELGDTVRLHLNIGLDL